MVKFWGDRLTKYDNSTLVVYSMDPFGPDILTHGGPSAYPPNRSLAVLPSSIFLAWTNESVGGPLHGGHHAYFSCDIGRGRNPRRAEPDGRGALCQLRVFRDASGEHVW